MIRSTPPRETPPARSETSAEPLLWKIETLVGGCREARILHEGEIYRLRITSKQRLILTK